MNKVITATIVIFVIAISLTMSGCIAPDGIWTFDGTVSHSDEELVPEATPEVVTPRPTPVPTQPDPCEGVDCSSECYKYNLYSTRCVDGVCEMDYLIEYNSPTCGYVVPKPTPIPTQPDPCEGVDCSSECYKYNLYGTRCVDGVCVRYKIIETNSQTCGYVAPTPVPEPTAMPTPEPTAIAMPTPEPTAMPTPEPTAMPTPEPTAIMMPTPDVMPTPEPYHVNMPVSILFDDAEIYGITLDTDQTGWGVNHQGFVFDLWWTCKSCGTGGCVYEIGEDEDGTRLELLSNNNAVLYAGYDHVMGQWFCGEMAMPTPCEYEGEGETMDHFITIEPPIYSGVVRNNGEIIDIRITPSPLIAGCNYMVELDVLNTGTVTTCYEMEWSSDPERWIYVGDMETFVFTGTMGGPGERMWTFELYWDAEWPASNVLLQTATADVRCYTQYEVDNM